VTLLAFAAECHAAAQLLVGTCHCRLMAAIRMVLSSKPVARCGCGRIMTGQTDDCIIDPALHATRAVSINGTLVSK